jgi:hypothetical protein
MSPDPGTEHPARPAADDSLAAHAARVTQGDANAVEELLAQLEPLVPQLLAIVRRGRTASLQARIQSTGIVNEALHSLVNGLRRHRFEHLVSAKAVWDLLVVIVHHKLRTEVRRQMRDKRSPGREVRSDEGRPTFVARPADRPSEVPQSLLQAIEASHASVGDSTLAASTPDVSGPEQPAAVNPHLDAPAAELVAWLESWGDELRSVHPKAIDILEWSFCGWSTEQIGQILDLHRRSVQLIKQKLRALLEQKLGLKGDGDDPAPGHHTHR